MRGHKFFPNALTSRKAKNPKISMYFSRNMFIAFRAQHLLLAMGALMRPGVNF